MHLPPTLKPILLGAVGVALAFPILLSIWHVYEDHQLIDAIRLNIQQQQVQAPRPAPPAPKPQPPLTTPPTP